MGEPPLVLNYVATWRVPGWWPTALGDIMCQLWAASCEWCIAVGHTPLIFLGCPIKQDAIVPFFFLSLGVLGMLMSAQRVAVSGGFPPLGAGQFFCSVLLSIHRFWGYWVSGFTGTHGSRAGEFGFPCLSLYHNGFAVANLVIC